MSIRKGIVGGLTDVLVGGLTNAGNSAFSPSHIAGLTVWLDSAKGVTVTGSNVTTWADQSGHGNNATATGTTGPTLLASDPRYNGLPTLQFNASEVMFITNCGVTNAPCTIFTNCLFNSLQKIATTPNIPFCDQQQQTYLDYNINGMQGITGASTPYMLCGTNNAGENRSVCIVSNGTSSTTYYGDPVQSVAGGAAQTTFGPGMYIGGYNATPTYGLNGSMAEFIVYNRVLSPTEVTQVMTYLNSRYSMNTPYMMPNLALWMRADQTDGTNGGNIASWYDMSISNLIFGQSASANQFVYTLSDSNFGNQPSAISTALSNMISTRGLTMAQPFTVYSVFKTTSPSTTQVILTNDSVSFLFGLSSGHYQEYTPETEWTPGPDTNVHAACGVFDSTSSNFYIDNSSSGLTLFSGTGPTSGLDGNTITIGYAAGNSCLIGTAAEYMIFSGHHTQAQRAQVMSYLGKRYGQSWA
jgi:hypothetical protein